MTIPASKQRRHLSVAVRISIAVALATSTAQAQQPNPWKKANVDSLGSVNSENRLAVATSGVWDIDGEYQGTRGEYYKISGYFAYVAATTTSADRGESAVISMYLQPMAGGAADWLGARLRCSLANLTTRCVPINGAKALLDLNFVFKTIPFRGFESHAEITEPDEKQGEARFTGRNSPRGKFKLVPPDN